VTPTHDDPEFSDTPRGRGSLLDRIVGDGESPAWWGVPVGRLAGCEVRVHLVTPVFALAVLAYAVWNGMAVTFLATGLAALCLVVLLHEATRGHVLVRWCGLRPIDITLWPLGGVWRFETEGATDRAEAKGAAGGLAMLVGIGLLAGVSAAWATGDARTLVFDPLRPGLVLGELASTSTLTTIGLVALWQVYAAALYVLAVNLLPMLPLDGGVLLRAATARGEGRAAAGAGLVTGAVLLLGGLLSGLPIVAAIGFCGGVVCWSERQHARFILDPAGVDRWRAALDAGADPRETPTPGPPIPPDEREQIERILAKISDRGMASLTRSERRLLQRATDKLRGS